MASGAQMIRYVAKDAVKAVVFWIVASIALVYFFGYTGRMLSSFLGMILIVCYIGVCLKHLVWFLQGKNVLPGPTGYRPRTPTGTNAPAGVQEKPCPSCSGGRITCYSCNGSGSRYDGSGQMALCTTCMGQRALPCSTCAGSGRVYW